MMTEEMIWEIYLTMQGQLTESPWKKDIQNLYESGKDCDLLYTEVYTTKVRLMNRLHSPDDEELETMVNDLLMIAEQHAFEMFRCGYRLGTKKKEK